MNSNKIGFKESVRLLCRGFQLINSFGEHVLLSMILKSVFTAVYPFINIYLSALIINELVGARRVEHLTRLAGITIATNLVCLLIKNVLTRWAQGKEGTYWEMCQCTLDHKMREMDYIDTQDPEIRAQFDLANMHQSGMGFGLVILVWNGVEKLVTGVTQVFASIVLTVGMFLAVADKEGFLWLNSWWLNVLMVCAVLAPILVSALVSAKISRMYAEASEDNNQGNRLFRWMNTFSDDENQRDVRLYRQEKIVKLGIEHEIFERIGRKVGVLSAGNIVFNALSNGAVYLFAAMKALGGAFGVGNVVQYVSAVTQFIGGVNELVDLVNQWRGNMPYLKKYMELLDIPKKKYMGSISVEQRDDNEYEIEFHNVSFKYPGADTYALKNLNLKFKIGERMAVVGENGSGKSTMVNLLCRLYEPTEGYISLNGIDIKKYNYDQYMAIFGVVFQDFVLFPFTLGENVAVSSKYDAKRVRESLEKAGFADKLSTWKNGLDTYLYKDFTEEGVNVSGGEAQKIALARAIYKDAPFIVLDEPTAALDPVSEFEIYSKFNEIVEDKTAVYISHRLSSCRFCSDIVVFDHGRLVERGTHEGLLAAHGKYAELWNAQAQYYE